ncbi:hypothetical protein IscW_ISCW002024 [Ixodes scapularis]|uniref:Secreted protein n=1 Tax=Ixodes scapularis TaxID=6945 RepID=B7PCG6_IXOSC|nr:hypothetical protein IscW_ISCW002024 [Ixodes scapularis]|eukprot:XP_002409823.1 hypothetical protein IscW_ISCW002024 [Ixodes scapularis]
MKVLVMVALLAALVYRTSSADMCDVLSQDPTRVEMIYVCIEALASPKLKYEIYDKMKTYYPCDKTKTGTMKAVALAALLAYGLVCLASADICDDVYDDPTKVERLFTCVEGHASPELKTKLEQLKRRYNNYYCFTRVGCVKFRFDPDLYSEFSQWRNVCTKDKTLRGNALPLLNADLECDSDTGTPRAAVLFGLGDREAPTDKPFRWVPGVFV